MYVCVPAAVVLRNALQARAAEAGLYRKQYEGLCCKLDSLEEHLRQSSSAARAKVSREALSMALAFSIWYLTAVHGSLVWHQAAACERLRSSADCL